MYFDKVYSVKVYSVNYAELRLYFPADAARPFFNRVHELAALDRAWRAKSPKGQMVLLYGRRRLGKTYLLQRFFAGTPGETPKPHCYFLADQTTEGAQRLLLADQTTEGAQRLLLADQVLAALPDAGVSAAEIAVSWNQILRYVGAQARARAAESGTGYRFGLVLDEFPYLAAKSPELPSIIQSWWDKEGTHSPILSVLCGSQLSAMEALGAESGPLFGRFTGGVFRLPPLRYDEVAAFYQGAPAYDVASCLLMYGVLGGTPRYHALVDTSRPVGEEITDLLLRPRGALEGEVNFLLGSEQIRDPAPYNAVLSAIASGATQFGKIQTVSGTERGSLSFYLKTLQELGWVRREFPFENAHEKRALYQVADPFLAFWYRFVAPLASRLAFSDAAFVYETLVAPLLSDYMGRFVFETVCYQWLQKNAQTVLGISLENARRWWSRDGQIELDIMAKIHGGGYLVGECKWSQNAPVGRNVYNHLLAKSEQLPEARYKNDPVCVLFSVGGFTKDLTDFALALENRLHLVGPELLLP